MWILCACLALASAPLPPLPVVSSDVESRLLAGEVVLQAMADGGVVGADLLAYLSAPPEAVWAQIVDYGSQAEWVPDLGEGSVLSTDGEVRRCQGLAPVPWPINDRRFILVVHARDEVIDGQPVHVASWELEPDSGNMVRNDGYWLVMPWKEGTLLSYRFRADAGLSIPDFLEERVTRRSMPKMITNLRGRLAR